MAGRRENEDEGVRVDQWLHAARFFKTRALAATAVKAHRVRVNEARVKPARVLKVGDRLDITRGPERITVIVLGLSRRRGPAPKARLLYEETPESVALRERESRARKLASDAVPRPDRRPDKRSRRRLIRFLRDQDSGE